MKAQGAGVREIARAARPRAVDDLAGAAPQRGDPGGKLEYRASVAQWKAELVARRPKTAKLVANDAAARLRAGAAVGAGPPPGRDAGRGPATAPWKGRNKPHREDRRWAHGLEPGADREPAAGRLPR